MPGRVKIGKGAHPRLLKGIQELPGHQGVFPVGLIKMPHKSLTVLDLLNEIIAVAIHNFVGDVMLLTIVNPSIVKGIAWHFMYSNHILCVIIMKIKASD
jgi:hypothetical protein